MACLKITMKVKQSNILLVMIYLSLAVPSTRGHHQNNEGYELTVWKNGHNHLENTSEVGISLLEEVPTAPEMSAFRALLIKSGVHESTARRIIGGDDVQPGQIYSIVSLRTRSGCRKRCPNPAHVCGGTLINKGFVLTAAHCCIEKEEAGKNLKKPTKIHEVWAGGLDVNKLLQKKKILKMAVHPKADGKTQYDICLLKVKKFKNDPRKAKMVKKASINDGKIKAGTKLVAAGWGANKEGQTGNMLPELQYITIKSISDKECIKRLKEVPEKRSGKKFDWRKLFYKGLLCTEQQKRQDACQGDSGGPLYGMEKEIEKKRGFDKGPWNFLVGINSWAPGCAREGYPAMYVDVQKFQGWIKKAYKQLKRKRK